MRTHSDKEENVICEMDGRFGVLFFGAVGGVGVLAIEVLVTGGADALRCW